MPARCIKDGCKNVCSAEDVIQAPNQLDGMKELYCDCCCTRFDHHPEYANGDPRDIAYIGKIIFDKRDVHYLNEIGIFVKYFILLQLQQNKDLVICLVNILSR